MSEINYDTIEQYLDGSLSSDAREAFEKEMQSNPGLANEVALYRTMDREMNESIQSREEKEKLAASLKTLNEQYFTRPVARVIRINRWAYAVSAIAAVAILIFLLRPFSNADFNNEELYAGYMQEVDKLDGSLRGNLQDTLVGKAAERYNNKDYRNALPLLKQITAAKPDETALLLATGICYMETNQPDSSLAVFTKLAAGNTVYKEQATWYTALGFLKQNKLDDCYRALQQIPPGGDKAREAASLMKKIEARLK